MTAMLNDFNEIQHTPLRVYNRTVFATNLLSDSGKEVMTDYLNQFTDGEKKQIFLMSNWIKAFGQKKVQQEVTKGLNPTYDPETDNG